jgi:hypothetical protein
MDEEEGEGEEVAGMQQERSTHAEFPFGDEMDEEEEERELEAALRLHQAVFPCAVLPRQWSSPQSCSRWSTVGGQEHLLGTFVYQG